MNWWFRNKKKYWQEYSKSRIFWIRIVLTLFAFDVIAYLQLASVPIYSLLNPFYFLNARLLDNRKEVILFSPSNNWLNSKLEFISVKKPLYYHEKKTTQARILLNELTLGKGLVTAHRNSKILNAVRQIWSIENKLILDISEKWYNSQKKSQLEAIEKTLVNNIDGINQIEWSISKESTNQVPVK